MLPHERLLEAGGGARITQAETTQPAAAQEAAQPTAAQEAAQPTAAAAAPGATAAPPAQAGAHKITIWGWPAADKAYESFTSDFKAAHPDIDLDIQMTKTADEHNKLLTSLAAGSGAPDVGMIEINSIDKFVVKGG